MKSKGQHLGRILKKISKGLANFEVSLAFRVMGSVGSTFSADPRDPKVGRGRQGSAFRDGLIKYIKKFLSKVV